MGKNKENNKKTQKFNKISTPSNVIFNIIFWILSLTCIIPIVFVAIISITGESSIQQYGYRFFPKEISFFAYQYLWESKGRIFTSYGISILITVAGTVLGLFLNATMGYVLSRKNFALKKFFTYVILIPMLFNGGMISFYLVVSGVLHLKNNLLALILPIAVSSFYIIVLRTFFVTTIPDSIIESAKIDGAGQLKIFFEIVLPISLPALATIGLFLTFSYWNDWFNAMLFIDKDELLPLQAVLMKIEKNVEFLKQNSSVMGGTASEVIASLPTESAKMAIVMLVTLPIACTYPFFQKYFVSGLTVGAVKG